MNDQQSQQDRFIALARELMQPSVVLLHHIPKWLIRKLQQARREGRFSCQCASMAQSLLDGAVAAAHKNSDTCNELLDHWGSTDKGTTFVTEPYHLNLVAAAEFARIVNLDWCYSANSYWFPGSTFRISFFERLPRH